MSWISGIEAAGDVLQYAFPTAVVLGEISPDVYAGRYTVAAEKLAISLGLITLQNRGTMVIKHITQKPRPSFPLDLESFPSGHMMIAMQCVTRVFFAYMQLPYRVLSVLCCIIIGFARYLPGKHDIIDLTAGGALGIALGTLWNHLIPTH